MVKWFHLTKFTIVIKEGVRIGSAVREVLGYVEAAPEQPGPHLPLLRGHVGLPGSERGQPVSVHLHGDVLPVVQRHLVKQHVALPEPLLLLKVVRCPKVCSAKVLHHQVKGAAALTLGHMLLIKLKLRVPQTVAAKVPPEVGQVEDTLIDLDPVDHHLDNLQKQSMSTLSNVILQCITTYISYPTIHYVSNKMKQFRLRLS